MKKWQARETALDVCVCLLWLIPLTLILIMLIIGVQIWTGKM